VLVNDVPPDAPVAPHGFRLNINSSDPPDGKRVSDYQYWSYDSPDAGRIDVYFSPGSQRVVRIFCYSGTSAGAAMPCPELFAISAGATENEVLKLLGTPSKTKIGGDIGAAKILYYSQWNVAFFLQQRRVYALQVGAETSTPMAIGKAPPAKCATAMDADQCADILTKAGKNPFDAHGFVGSSQYLADTMNRRQLLGRAAQRVVLLGSVLGVRPK
jgi:hypothetical protein